MKKNPKYIKKNDQHLMLLLLLVPFLQGMGIDLYVPSMPTIANYFHANTGLVQQTIGFYILAFGIGQLVLGILSDIIGRRKIMMASALCFTIASFLAALSTNIYFLIGCRFFQGLSIGGFGVTIRAVSTDCFKEKQLVKAMTYFSTSWALGPIIGPVIGGYLQHYFNWQADFYFFGIYGAVVLIYIFLALPETHTNLLSFNYKQIHCGIKNIITHPVFLLLLLMGLIFPNMMAKIFSIFPKQGGTTNALYGVLVALGVFFTTSLISVFKASSQIPMALIYIGLFLLCLVFFNFTIKLTFKKDKKLEAKVENINYEKATVPVD